MTAADQPPGITTEPPAAAKPPLDLAIAPAPPAPARGLKFMAVVWLIFAYVSGGPYGTEGAFSVTGPGLGLLLLIVIPLCWSVPISFIAAELTSAMPQEGGYVRWAKKMLGNFWSFQVGWWAWLRNIVESTLYPVLFIGYLQYFFPTLSKEQNPGAFWAIAIGMIALFTILNLMGVEAVGSAAVLFSLMVLAPFVVMLVLGIPQMHSVPWLPFLRPPEPGGPPVNLAACLGTALLVLIWNYNGWEDLSTCLGEFRNPRKEFPRALAVAVPMIVGTYCLTILVSLAAVGHNPASHWSHWGDEGGIGFPQIAQAIGGSWLGAWMAVAIMCGVCNQLSAILLATSRIPYALAVQRYLPAVFQRLTRKSRVPWVSVVFCSAAVVLLCNFDFEHLIGLDLTLYAGTLLPQIANIVQLRRKHADMEHAIKVPGGWPGLVLAAALPVALLSVGIWTTYQPDVLAFQHDLAGHQASLPTLWKAVGAHPGIQSLVLIAVILVVGVLAYLPARRRLAEESAPARNAEDVEEDLIMQTAPAVEAPAPGVAERTPD